MPTGPQGEEGPQGIRGIQGPKGDKGDQGNPGPLSVPTVFILTTSEDFPSGYEVQPTYSIPIEIKMLDMEDAVYLSPVNNTITFMKSGTYLINFVVQAKTKSQSSTDPNSNIISIGLRKLTEPTIYAGCSVFGNSTTPSLLVGYGTIVAEYRDWFELINTGKNSFIVTGPKTDNLKVESSLATPIVSIIIQKLK